MFYPYGDDRLRCSEMLSDSDIRFVVNSKMLFDHLVEGIEPLTNIRGQGMWFEPAFPAFTAKKLVDRPISGKRQFFFYARPHNLRNLYWRGLEAVAACIEENILSPDEWDFHFVGRDLTNFQLPRGVKPIIAQNLPWPDYVRLVDSIDVGLSLMDTPHPSYPPIDLAASGAVVVTNRHGRKTSLAQYSENILSVEPSIEGLRLGIIDAVELATDQERRKANFARSQINNDWEITFAPVLEQLFPAQK